MAIIQSRVFLFMSCLFAGAISVTSMAPLSMPIGLLIGLSVLYRALSIVESSKGAFLAGWLFGFGYFVFGLYWIGNALLVEGNPYAWAWPLAVCGLPVLLALFPALAAVCTKISSDLAKFSGYLSFTACFALFEILRGYLFTGFPWNLYGYVWAEFIEILQVLYYINIYGLTFLTLLWLSLPGFLIVSKASIGKKAFITALNLALFAGVFYFGQNRLEHNPATFDKSVQIKIIQPNIAQADKWKRDLMADHFMTLLDLSVPQENSSTADTTLIIWPETATSYHFLNNEYYRGELNSVLSAFNNDVFLLTGFMDKNETNNTFANALLSIDKSGAAVSSYKKSHLVPFGEYIPFQKYVPLQPVVQFSGFERGNGSYPTALKDGLGFAPLVCYESIFPHKVENANLRANLIVNVTNDGWYGDSSGPYQHFQQTRFRAIEEGIPLVRSANTGISALIDPYGRVVSKADLLTKGVIKEYLPIAIENIGVNNHYKIFGLLCIIFIIIAASYIQKHIRLKQ